MRRPRDEDELFLSFKPLVEEFTVGGRNQVVIRSVNNDQWAFHRVDLFQVVEREPQVDRGKEEGDLGIRQVSEGSIGRFQHQAFDRMARGDVDRDPCSDGAPVDDDVSRVEPFFSDQEIVRRCRVCVKATFADGPRAFSVASVVDEEDAVIELHKVFRDELPSAEVAGVAVEIEDHLIPRAFVEKRVDALMVFGGDEDFLAGLPQLEPEILRESAGIEYEPCL